MWVTKRQCVGKPAGFFALTFLTHFFHNLAHRLNSLNSPLTWGYNRFPQNVGLVTTTTYTYIKTPVRFPFEDFKTQLLKTCKVLQLREG
jgi:hypothetical protein